MGCALGKEYRDSLGGGRQGWVLGEGMTTTSLTAVGQDTERATGTAGRAYEARLTPWRRHSSAPLR